MKRLWLLLLLAGFLGSVNQAEARVRQASIAVTDEANHGQKITLGEFEGSYLDPSGRPTVLCDQVLPKNNIVPVRGRVIPADRQGLSGI